MEIGTAILLQITKKLIESINPFARKLKLPAVDLEANLARHLEYIDAWSDRIQLFDMPRHMSASRTTKIRIATKPRRFRGEKSETDYMTEYQLISRNNNYILLGDPGSGKTTTLKRLARQLLTEEPAEHQDAFQYPIVIRVRDLKFCGNLHVALADIIGLSYPDVPLSRPGKPNENKISRSMAGEAPLAQAIDTFLNSTRALVLIDGIDESSNAIRSELEETLAQLSFHALNYRVLATCRSGDYVRRIDGFNIVELAPLSDAEIREIANLWAEDADNFVVAVEKTSYSDMLDRPLLLAQLITLHNNIRRLPERSCDVYK